MSNTVKFNTRGSIAPESTSSSNDDDDDDDQNWEDWDSDSLSRSCKSLFEDKTLPTVKNALEYDKATHGFDLYETYKRLDLDLHQRIRLVNYIRKNKPSPPDLASLNGKESLFFSDDYLRPALEDDPLLMVAGDMSDSDSDSDEEEGSVTDSIHRIRVLEKKLATARKHLADYGALVRERLKTLETSDDPGPANTIPSTTQDDDSYYFQSYNDNDIHAVMIQDKVRTSSYASFILKNPSIFRDAVVLDVGCGTGILSLFAARGGAKRVIAVDASDIVEKAKEIVRANGFEDVITVIRGKIEDVALPDGISQVDIIISEWMGYALLYESMLDSVLRARDRFLRPDGGIMAPSQCRVMLGLCDASEVLKDRVDFWNDLYGFDLSVMAKDLYEEAIIDVVNPEKMLSEPFVIKDLHLGKVTPRQLDFASPFILVSSSETRVKVTAFLLYFDTFFNATGEPVPPDTGVHVIKPSDPTLVEIWPVGGKRPPQRRKSNIFRDVDQIVSFSTGPNSIPTHWKQTLFLLREPITVVEGTVVSGVFHCRKSETNPRALDVEIHYSARAEVADAQAGGDVTVQMFRVK